MIALALGFGCGAIELWLLQLLVKEISSAKTLPVWIIPTKLAVLALFIVPCALWWPGDLFLAAVGITGVLIVGAVIIFVRQTKKEGRSS